MTGPAEYSIAMRRQHGDPRWVQAVMRKRWFDIAQLQSSSRVYAEAWVDVSGMTETETVAAVLHDLRLAVLDGLE